MKTIKNHPLVQEVETGEEFGGWQKYYVFLKKGYVFDSRGGRTRGFNTVSEFLGHIKWDVSKIGEDDDKRNI